MSWIIERRGFKGEALPRPDYYAGPMPAGEEHTSWTRQRDEALRFARHEDAQRFAAHGFFCNVQVLACAEAGPLARAA